MKTLARILPPQKNLFTLAIVLCAAGAAHGQTLSTGTFNSDTVFTLAGPASSEVYGLATNGGTGTITTANGYSFADSASAAGQADITMAGSYFASYSGFLGSTSTGDTGLNGLINTSLYGHAVTYTLKNLTAGATYTALVFAADDRGSGSGDNVFSLTDGNMTSASQTFVFPNGVGAIGTQTLGGYLLDTFTATGTSHVITVPNEQEGQGVLLEEVVPEPSTYALMLGGFGALMLGVRLRRRATQPS